MQLIIHATIIVPLGNQARRNSRSSAAGVSSMWRRPPGRVWSRSGRLGVRAPVGGGGAGAKGVSGEAAGDGINGGETRGPCGQTDARARSRVFPPSACFLSGHLYCSSWKLFAVHSPPVRGSQSTLPRPSGTKQRVRICPASHRVAGAAVTAQPFPAGFPCPGPALLAGATEARPWHPVM